MSPCFPLTPKGNFDCLRKCLQDCILDHAVIISYVHFAFAALFLLTLAYSSLFLFTKTDPNFSPTPEKEWRNFFYKLCGYIILASIALIAIIFYFDLDKNTSNPVFWLESLAIVAFGFSWLLKGETMLRDATEPTSAQ